MIICVGKKNDSINQYCVSCTMIKVKLYFKYVNLGTQGCGKTLLIKKLAANDSPDSVSKHAASVPTTGKNKINFFRY